MALSTGTPLSILQIWIVWYVRLLFVRFFPWSLNRRKLLLFNTIVCPHLTLSRLVVASLFNPIFLIHRASGFNFIVIFFLLAFSLSYCSFLLFQSVQIVYKTICNNNCRRKKVQCVGTCNVTAVFMDTDFSLN